jgi:hypothetical protein
MGNFELFKKIKIYNNFLILKNYKKNRTFSNIKLLGIYKEYSYNDNMVDNYVYEDI